MPDLQHPVFAWQYTFTRVAKAAYNRKCIQHAFPYGRGSCNRAQAELLKPYIYGSTEQAAGFTAEKEPLLVPQSHQELNTGDARQTGEGLELVCLLLRSGLALLILGRRVLPLPAEAFSWRTCPLALWT